jgi:bacterioferritin-associated ferredoxin
LIKSNASPRSIWLNCRWMRLQYELTTIRIGNTLGASSRGVIAVMYVCMCNGVTEAAIRRAARSGIRTLGELAMSTGCTAGCGCCSETAEELLREALQGELPTLQSSRSDGMLALA